MTRDLKIRRAKKKDLGRLVEIEHRTFTTDVLSRRSFRHFILPGAHDLRVALIDAEIAGYVLVLYRPGTSLARMYSIAVAPEHQGKGIASRLMAVAEEAGREHLCSFMRLEVDVNNTPARTLYEKLGYRGVGKIEGYYEDGSDALQMEKQIYSGPPRKEITAPYYEQTTDFSCGPAALMMAMKTLEPGYQMTRREELQIWREATTIFMTSGHGGCSPHGLALSAWSRGFDVDMYINRHGAPFVDGVRDPDKKAVVELVHEDFVARIEDTGIRLHLQDIKPEQLRSFLEEGKTLVTLISTWRLNRNKAPHWVFAAGADENFVYINDPDISDRPWQSETDYIRVPIGIQEFIDMACFGRSRLRCVLVLDKRSSRKKAVKK